MTDHSKESHSALKSPRGITGLILRLARVRQVSHPSMATRAHIGLLQGWVSVVINAVLSVVKMALGLWSGSVALIADAVHSLSDVGTSMIVVCGFYWARKPRDSRHPFGHGRIELITALVMAVILVVLAVEFARFGIGRILAPRDLQAPLWMIIAVAGTVLIKQWLAVFAHELAGVSGSPALRADYWHHVADALSTVLVLAALIAARFGWVGVDGWAALGVAGFILYAGYITARDAIHPLLGEAPPPEEIQRVESAACSVAGVRGAHDVILHTYGDDRVISFHIEVDAAASALKAHDLAEQAEDAVEQSMGGKAIAHVDPVDRSHPQYGQAESTLADVVIDHQDLTAFHDLRIDGPAHRLSLSVDVVTVTGLSDARYPDIEQAIQQAIRERMPELKDVHVTVETGYH